MRSNAARFGANKDRLIGPFVFGGFARAKIAKSASVWRRLIRLGFFGGGGCCESGMRHQMQFLLL